MNNKNKIKKRNQQKGFSVTLTTNIQIDCDAQYGILIVISQISYLIQRY